MIGHRVITFASKQRKERKMKEKIEAAFETIRASVRKDHKPNMLSSDWQDSHQRILATIDEQELVLLPKEKK